MEKNEKKNKEKPRIKEKNNNDTLSLVCGTVQTKVKKQLFNPETKCHA